MQQSLARRAVTAALAVTSSQGLAADEAVVLHDSNKLTLRLQPCEVVARVAPAAEQVAQFEVELAQRLVAAGCPVAALDPRVEPRPYARDGFVITLWTYHPPTTEGSPEPTLYADALARLHAGMRTVQIATPHSTDRVDAAERLLASPGRTPALTDADRELLIETLRTLRPVIGRRDREQLLHGEPHPGNLVAAEAGPLFVDLETCCRGPVEFDLAHAPDGVGEQYPGVDLGVLRDCRLLVLAMITTWRWDVDDQHPGGHELGRSWLSDLRAALAH